jgi:hypothetical protein
MSKEWRRVIGGFILAAGLLTVITILLTLPDCVQPAGDEFVGCRDPTIPALVVGAVTLVLAGPLLLSSRKSRKP